MLARLPAVVQGASGQAASRRPAQVTCFQRPALALPAARRAAGFLGQTALNARPAAQLARALPDRKRCVQVKAAAAASGASGAAGDSDKSGLTQTLILGGLFAGWYAANIYFNIYNKTVLKVFPFPLTCTTVQFFVGSIITVACWAAGVVKVPHVTASTLVRIAPLAMAHTLGNLLTNMSLGAVAVSFTHTIKASEPFFSVLLSALVLGDIPNPIVLATLLPIVGGVAIASLTEASFNWLGFLTAMGSNLTFQSRNVLSKKLMIAKGSAAIDKTNLFGLMTIVSFLMLLPVNLLVEGWQLAPGPLAAMGVADPQGVVMRAISAGLTFHLYQQISYLILERVSPVTHSIGNCVKRVVVIVASVFFFQNPMSMQNAIGTGIALAGVFAYSQAKRLTAKPGTKVSSSD